MEARISLPAESLAQACVAAGSRGPLANGAVHRAGLRSSYPATARLVDCRLGSVGHLRRRRHRERDGTGGATAGEKDVGVRGGNVAQRALEAGVLDEVQVHQVPVVLRGGRRLFEVLPAFIELEIRRVIDTQRRTTSGAGCVTDRCGAKTGRLEVRWHSCRSRPLADGSPAATGGEAPGHKPPAWPGAVHSVNSWVPTWLWSRLARDAPASVWRPSRSAARP